MADATSESYINEINERDAEARKIREDAIEYAEKVSRGEEPWKDEEADVNDTPEEEETAPDFTAVEEPRNDDVDEAGEPGDEVVEVDQDNPAPEPTE